MIVLGGGAIGLELAQAFARFGVEVTVVEALDRILGPEEPESRRLLTEVLRAEGIDVHTGGRRRVGVAGTATGVTGGPRRRQRDRRRRAARRGRPHARTSRGIGLDTVGLDETARPAFTVDDRMRVNGVDGVWAVGDITGTGAFTHVAVYQAADRRRRHPRRAASPTADTSRASRG